VKLLERLNRAVLGLEQGFLTALFSVMILLAFSQVILRNFFSLGLVWADPFLRLSVLWLGFIGASLATQHDKHIRIDLMGRFLSPKTAAAVSVLTGAFTTAVCVFLAVASWTFVANEMEFEDTIFTVAGFQVPSWWAQLILPVGFTLMALRFFFRSAGTLLSLLKGDVGKKEGPVTSA
jgi:C4-dicarboxylate transporter DctQ subunit